jgi:eukaryotic-like serine/threonine-protein kinase
MFIGDETNAVAAGRTTTRDFVPPEEFDDYVILSELGRGQMGRVYLAEDALLARQVAIKFIAGVEPDMEARQRFLMEARAAARIQHPNVLGVFRVGELGDRLYIVSELVRGKSLAEMAKPMPWNEVLDIAIELARGLAAAHRRGVVHCDIKTANAMITEDNVAKLVDFGLARVAHEGDERDTDVMVGTPDYMAPEVWTGRTPSRRSDVYSFGAVLFELLTGKVPFADVEPLELAKTVTEHDAPDLASRVTDIDPRFAKLVARCLDRDAEKRFPSGEELREALEQIHPSRAVAVKSDENPYRGLRPFEATHRGLFFGRGLEIGELVERLRTDAVTIVTGDSGVGKSSLCRAGVVPAILDGAIGNQRKWEALTMIPGRRPLTALANAVGDPSLAQRVLEDPEELPRELQRRAGKEKGIVLFVDQMEEMVTVADALEAAALDAGLARLTEGVPGIRIIMTVRADFLAKIAALPRIGRELSRLLYFVSPLPPERIRDVVTGPATATGVEFESPELIQSLVDATAQAGSGGLPLLSFALAELWERREGTTITQAALDTMGGVAGALARHGDNVISGMSSTERANIRRVLLRLVTSVGTRARRTAAELDVSAGTKVALDALVKGRLLVVHHGDEGTTYEVAHEVLVNGWGTLREWLDDDAEDRARRERLAAAATEWEKTKRRGDLTFRGPRLVEARALDATNLTQLEHAFIAASVRATSRRKWLVRITAAGVVVLLVGVYAVQRYVAARNLAREVAVEITAAHQSLVAARSAEAAQSEQAQQTYALFDSGKLADGERAWKTVLQSRTTADTAYRAAGGRLEAALAKDPTRADVREQLGDVLLERAELAEAMYQTDRRDELVARLAGYDPEGKRRARWNQPGTLIVHAPADATIAIGDKQLGVGTATVELPPGNYLVDVRAPSQPSVRGAAIVERGKPTEITLAAPSSAVPEGFIYIPEGDYLYGSADPERVRTDFLQAAPLHRRHSNAFAIAKYEVTIAQWLEYAAANPGVPTPNMRIEGAGTLSITRDGEHWKFAMQPNATSYKAKWGERVEYTGRTTLASQDWRRFPIAGITPLEFAPFVAWLAKTGRVPGARFCTEQEWVRAARGADGRSYTTGDRIEFSQTNLDVSHTRPFMGYDEVGSYPAAQSPFGLDDMIGNVFEFTSEGSDAYICKGSSYTHDRWSGHIANRYVVTSDYKDVALGLRLCATVKP